MIKSVIQTIESEVGEQRGEFFGMILNTLGASLLGNMLAGKGVVRVDELTIGLSELAMGLFKLVVECLYLD